MIIDNNEKDFISEVEHTVCEHHKKHPNDTSYAGCGCVSSYDIVRKTIAQQPLSGSADASPKSKQLPIENFAHEQEDIPEEFAKVINDNFMELL
jgi:hypothetical protein